jgi:Fe-S cluster biosynthesis and repair protein YggX
MTRTVQCVVLKREAEGMDKPPHPGELGRRIFDNVSQEGWKQWLERVTTIINENGLSTADPQSMELIEKHMLGFFFGEGDYGQLPAGFRQGGGGKK